MVNVLDNTLEDWTDLAGKHDWSGLLVGNGFSQNIWPSFGYASLFENATRDGGAHLVPADISLFDRLETRNFEVVLSALITSRIVSNALGQPFDHFTDREESIRAALIRAVHGVHVPWGGVSEAVLDRVAEELSKYSSIYCTNYDLLIYWSIMRDPESFRDYFWAQQFDITNTEVWGKKSKAHFLHGGLHLYRLLNGQTLKRRANEGQNLLDLFGTPYQDAMPLFISEGTAEEKLASIYRSDYLSFVFSTLSQDAGPLVVFGHSLSESDRHIANVIGSHKGRPVAVSVRADCNVRQRKAQIIDALPDATPYFFDAASHPLGAADLIIEEPNI